MNLGDSVQNRAGIYFDFNPVVITNTQITRIKTPPALPPTPTVNFIANNYCGSMTEQQVRITNLPPAGTSAKALINATLLPIGIDSIFRFTPQQLQPGNHLIMVKFSNESGDAASVYPLEIIAAAVPNVDVTASTTQITSTSDQVMLTAVNKQGGGNSPLYSFAKDRNFVSVLQAESSSASTTLTADQLVEGDNWIYAKMKSSEACVTTATSVDSIKILKNLNVTGIIDIDNPSVVISTYPNPFAKKIMVTGLQFSKSYLISVTDNLGHRIYQRSFAGAQLMKLPTNAWSNGAYWISIYDKKKNKLIGTIRLVKP